MKTSELTGAALDWAVDKAEGRIRPDGGYYCSHHGRITHWSTDWSQGGPIIEREGLTAEYLHDSRWIARHPTAKRNSRPIFGEGPTPLIAAMRCYVASKLGDTVDLPPELA